jgi:hypothetical protein
MPEIYVDPVRYGRAAGSGVTLCLNEDSPGHRGPGITNRSKERFCDIPCFMKKREQNR